MRAIVVVFLLSFVAVGCKKKEEPKPAPAPTAPTVTPSPTAAPGLPQDAESVVTGLMSAFNEGKLDEAVAFFAEDHEEISATTADQPVKGREALHEKWLLQKAAFADLRWAAKRIFDAGGVWVIQGVALGTHTGAYRGYKATGEKVGYEFLRWAHVENGQLRRSVLYAPTAVVLRQIKALRGRVPPIPAWPEKPEVVSGDANQALLETVIGVHKGLSEGKFEAAEAASHADVIMSRFGTGRIVRGIADMRKGYEAHRKAFPDSQRVLEVVVGVGDWVLVRGILTGTHKGEFLGAKPTGAAIASHFADVIRFDAGKVRAIEAYSDPVEVLEPLGLLAMRETPKVGQKTKGN